MNKRQSNISMVSNMVNDIDELIDILERQQITIMQFNEIASQLGVVLTDFQLGQIESSKRMTSLAIDQVKDLSNSLKGE